MHFFLVVTTQVYFLEVFSALEVGDNLFDGVVWAHLRRFKH